MTWLDLFQFLNERANDFENLDKFNWQQEVSVFDYETLEYYPTNFITTPDGKTSLSVDTSTQKEVTNGFGN
ncbi:MAG: hypothetical protein EBS98_09395 [Chitinophagia bacterium]|nr:hypothetical protein [Chitinophagia bacterium]